MLRHPGPSAGWELTQIKACFHPLAPHPPSAPTLPARMPPEPPLLPPGPPPLHPLLPLNSCQRGSDCECGVCTREWLSCAGQKFPPSSCLNSIVCVRDFFSFFPHANCRNLKLVSIESFNGKFLFEMSGSQHDQTQPPLIGGEVRTPAAGGSTLSLPPLSQS